MSAFSHSVPPAGQDAVGNANGLRSAIFRKSRSFGRLTTSVIRSCSWAVPRGVRYVWVNSTKDFFLCLGFELIFPMLPLALELDFTHSISERSLTLVAVVYLIALGVGGRDRLLAGLSFAAAVLAAVLAGSALAPGRSQVNQPLLDGSVATWGLIAVVFLSHLVERFRRYGVKKERYWLFN